MFPIELRNFYETTKETMPRSPLTGYPVAGALLVEREGR